MANATSTGGTLATGAAPPDQKSRADGDWGAHTGTTQQQPEGFWQTTYNDPVAVFTLALAIATTGLWGFTAALWRATYQLSKDAKASGEAQADMMERSLAEARVSADAARASVEISQDTAKRQLRAYVGVISAKIRNWTPGKTPVFLFEFRNAGQTPAIGVVARVFSCATSEDCERVKMDRWAHEDPSWSVMSILPGASSFSATPLDEPLTQKEYDEVLRGDWTWVIGGYVAYKDAFGARRITMFRVYLDKERIPHAKKTVELYACHRGNHSS